ncbi:TonB system transport protein ExbD [Aureimonas populi]|uniref:Biopolymer transport protein ExbD n=1 Tax=Aureimonas populi TaxID=1701758 RepID=A0ABW5CRD3_9HYPH|nr:TonB system transport protein ExbD [Aureimonas populi]
MAVNLKDSDAEGGDEMSEINVTPFIDVVLVLLIVFMVAAPLSTVDVPVDLPVSNAVPQERPDEPIYLTVQDDLSISLGEERLAPQTLQAALDARTQGDREQRIFLRADEVVAYGDLMGVMNELRRAGYLKIALVGVEDPAAAAQQAAAAPAAPTTGTP